ncbi:unnamed protein product [Linum trigynum]|uniref:Gnk2-homologous domain-containing protein n=1 Tax=Linum trigynum TaxID=586398 RepID=A0AAV2GFN2_9ROSI
MASTAFLFRLDLMAMTVITISSATTTFIILSNAADPKDQLCLAPPDHGLFYHDCSNQTLPSSNLQVDVVAFARKKMGQELQSNSFDSCGQHKFYSEGGDDQVGTDFYFYAGCSHGLRRDQCEDCVQDASRVVRGYCLDSAWAQAASVFCCLQYQQYQFC